MSLPRANTAPVPRVVPAQSLDECVPMEPTASQQMEEDFDADMDLADIDLDANAYPNNLGGAGSSTGPKSTSQEASNVSAATKVTNG